VVGVAGGLWIATGLWRWLAGLEKAADYYAHNHIFLTKMGLLVVLLTLEVSPMITLIHWRRRLAAGAAPDTAEARCLSQISLVQTGLVVLMLLAAVAMARGYGMRAP
jgi:putative membrane protein